jgi:hypothetical protein
MQTHGGSARRRHSTAGVTALASIGRTFLYGQASMRRVEHEAVQIGIHNPAIPDETTNGDV